MVHWDGHNEVANEDGNENENYDPNNNEHDSGDGEESGGSSSDESEGETENPESDVIEKIRQWALTNPPIPHSRLETLLQILREDYPNLPKSARTFLQTDKINYKIEKFSENGDDQFVYFGMTENLRAQINPALHEVNSIELLFNVDGLPLFKPSSQEIWPILC